MGRRRLIIVQINSGLGNQMFQYAFGKALEKSYKCNVFFDLNSDFDTPQYRKFELNPFKINNKRANLLLLLYFRPIKDYILITENFKFIKRLIIRILRKYFNLILFNILRLYARPLFIEEVDICSYQPNYFGQKNKFIYFKGYFHNELFFKTIENEIRNSFKLKVDYLANTEIANRIKNSNSVSIHIRRGDYLEHSIFCILSIDYYLRAMQYIRQQIENVCFFVFSDDIMWAKNTFSNLSDNLIFSEQKFSENACDDMILMSLCKHNIIANSTYSWWAAWLNNNPEKIVICPKLWYTNNEDNLSVQLNMLPSGWMKI